MLKSRPMIFFDIDDTLLNHSSAQDAAAAELFNLYAARLGQGEAEFPTVWRAATSRYFGAFARGEISFVQHRRNCIKSVFREPAMGDNEADTLYNHYAHHYAENWALFPDTVSGLESLRDHSLGIYCIGDPELQEQKLARFGLARYFKSIVVLRGSEVARSTHANFDLVAARAGVDKANCVYVGDELENDVFAACAAGWRGIWIDRTTQMIPPQGVESLTDLRMLRWLMANS